ncbi:hypothetical protein M3P19_04930 [Muricauda sp. 2012CJ35-5]|uniref:Lipoprotein n=1 Tax=Flagellimonas spongiicola TaxID=2942208 RepID=A0ABT0PQU3_9FLAO|nr:hypothetical protein [Allomuricauda spongiicola]MCL6273341.1 hypothetical protein [Allomuricauda spongiicola]
MKKIILIAVGLCIFYSCNTQQLEEKLMQTEAKLTETEQDLLASNNLNAVQYDLLKMYEETRENLVFTYGENYTIRVDKTKDGKLRFVAWKQPKNNFDLPDILSFNAEVIKPKTRGVTKYQFVQDSLTYAVEVIPIRKDRTRKQVFLEIFDRSKAKFYSKLNDMPSMD